mmetsp:Transcript_18855/g.48082  ORF Transcript_18855/g.48082 Transcript_18855/m.48082 type:complete len:195 (-) Transcript_18855:186-770(-)
MAGVPRTAASLLRELRTSTWLPNWNEATVQVAVDEIDELYAYTVDVMNQPGFERDSPEWISTILTGREMVMYARSCLVVHCAFRLGKVVELRWAAAGRLPDANRELLSPAELRFADAYDDLLAEYMFEMGGLDLTAGATPPKDLYVEVRVEKSGGAVMLESGQTLQLVAHERHLLRRTDVEPLIRQGLVAHCNK